MSSDEDGVPRYYYGEHSNNSALNAYISTHDATYESYSTSTDDGYSSFGSIHDKEEAKYHRPMNVLNPQTPFNIQDGNAYTERHALLDKDANHEMHGRLLREKVMKHHKYYYSALGSRHIWCVVGVTALNHLLRKFYEYFAFFLSISIGISFYSITWSVAALDFAAILSSTLLLPFVITKSPHFIQFCCEMMIGLSMLCSIWWDSLVGLFILRFIFGCAYMLILSSWSACISTFVSPSKQSSAIGRIDLSWSFASFFFILCAYIMDQYGADYIFYILSILAILASFVLFSIMPSQKLIRTEIDPDNFKEKLLSMFHLILCRDISTAIFLVVIGLVAFVNTALTLLLAPWLFTDYALSITEFGYCTVIIGTAQVVAIIFSYQFGNKLGVGWSLVAGILVQCLMFVLILLLNSNDGVLYQYIAVETSADADHYTFPLLFILLILAIHFIAAEFTYINAVTCMLHIAPQPVVSSKTIAANAMRFVTSCCRICAAIAAPYLWYNGLFYITAVVLLGIAFAMHLGLMLYITGCVWDRNAENEQYMCVSSRSNPSTPKSAYLFENDADYPNITRKDEMDDEMNDEYIAKILSTDIDFFNQRI
eukprot:254989_1